MDENQTIKKRKLLYVIGPVALIIALVGVTYAFFNYTRTGSANTLVVGNIYFNHTQGNEISIENVFPENRQAARNKNNNYVTFQVTGENESDKDIYYKLLLSHGNSITGRNRIGDQYLRFDLIEILSDNSEKYILYDESFNTINNTVLVKDRVLAGTTSTVTRNYKLRMWIDDGILISDTNEDRDYTTSEWENLFASVKVTVIGNMQDVKYYNSLDDAVTAINGNTFTSTLPKSGAKIGIYQDSEDNSTNLVLYDDLDLSTNYTITRPVDVNLYGHEIEFHYGSSGFISMIFANTFRIENGTVTAELVEGNSTKAFGIISSAGNGVINGVELPYVSERNGSAVTASNGGSLSIKNSNFLHQLQTNVNNGNVDIINTHFDGTIDANYNSTMEIKDSYVEHSYYPINNLVIIGSTSSITVDNSTIFADTPACYANEDTQQYYWCTVGIENFGTLMFNSGYVFGAHSGVTAAPGSKTYVYGGTFESTHHGGFYLAPGPSGVVYIENANIRGTSYPAQGNYRPNGTVDHTVTVGGTTYEINEYMSAFYIGGDTTENNENVYIVNSNISANNSPIFVMRYSTPRQNLYMSGCKLQNTFADQYLRIDYFNTMRLYNGANNDFGLITKFGKASDLRTYAEAVQAGTIVETGVDYKGIVSPE